MKERGLMYPIRTILVVSICLFVAAAAAAQHSIVRLSSGEGIHECGEKMSLATAEAVTADIAFCKDSVGGFAVVGFGSPGEVQTFTVTQTVAGILQFSNSEIGPFGETVEVVVTIGPDGSGQSAPFYAKGTNLGQTVFSACSPRRCAINQVSALVHNVASLEFEEHNSPLDSNPNAGGGLRMFPDKVSAGDTVNRRTVLIRARLSSAIAGVRVYFKGFDVDDPSTDDSPVDPNLDNGDDNRGAEDLAGTAVAQTDANGEALAILTVTTRPGDNYKIAAACDPFYLTELAVDGTDLKSVIDHRVLPTDRANATPMLTVWRRLHVELDSMMPVTGNAATGTIVSTRPRRRRGTTVLTLDGIMPDEDYTRFNGERIAIDGIGSFVVAEYTRRTITVNGIIEKSALAALGNAFTLVDDDDFNDNDGTALDGDEGESLPLPDTDLLQDSDDPSANVFADAYVRPVYDVGNPSDQEAPFIGNSYEIPLITATYEFDAINTEADNDFWTVYLLGAYQYTRDYDRDPDGEAAEPGKGGVLGVVDNFVGVGASVFVELLRPKEGLTITGVTNHAATAAHEIGHLFDGRHEEEGLMAQSSTRTSIRFTPATLNKIRSLLHP